MKKKYTTLALLCMLLMTKKVEAKEVNIKIPDFKVTINGVEMEKDYNKYPVIVSKDITYFPMTYKNSRFLGVSTFWSDATRTLEIKNNKAKGEYYDYRGELNKKYGVSTLAEFNVILNNTNIDNAKEKYPLLVYRGVTYFPLTWRFCHDEFSWTYNFDDKNGLVISSMDKENNSENKENTSSNIDLSKFDKALIKYDLSKKVNGIDYLIGRNMQTSNLVISKIDKDIAVEVKDLKKNGSNLVLDGNSLYFTVNYDNKKTVNTIDLSTMKDSEIAEIATGKWDPILMTALGGKVYYKTSVGNGALFNQDNKRLNESGSLTGLKNFGNYVVATFDSGDNLLVFDKNQNIIAKSKGNIDINTVNISNNTITFKDINSNTTKKLNI